MPGFVLNTVLIVLGALALWGAFDFIMESVRVFLRSLRRFREGNRD